MVSCEPWSPRTTSALRSVLEPVDLRTLAEGSLQRFSAVAERARHRLLVTFRRSGCGPRKGTSRVGRPPMRRPHRQCVPLRRKRGLGPGARRRTRELRQLRGRRQRAGIPPEQRASLFDRFHRGTDEGDGAGLGLAIADAVVRSTGGKWRVSDAPGRGAHMEVIWRRFYPRDDGPDREQRRRTDGQNSGRRGGLPVTRIKAVPEGQTHNRAVPWGPPKD